MQLLWKEQKNTFQLKVFNRKLYQDPNYMFSEEEWNYIFITKRRRGGKKSVKAMRWKLKQIDIHISFWWIWQSPLTALQWCFFCFFFTEVNVAEGCDEKRMKMGAWRGRRRATFMELNEFSPISMWGDVTTLRNKWSLVHSRLIIYGSLLEL